MGTVASTFPTLVDVTKRMAPDGGILQVAEVLSQVNPMLDDIPFLEGNLPIGHRVGIRTALPTPKWRRFNQGINPDVSKSDTFDEVIGMMENYSKLDVDLAKLNGNSAAFRFSEDKAFIQGFNIEFATGLLYHSVLSAPEKFTGLTPRMNSTTLSDSQLIHTPGYSNQIVIGDGTASGSDQTSIWLIGWGEDSVFGIYPKGSEAGLQTKDLGEQLVLDASSKQFLALVTRFQWKVGLCVKDYRQICRIANIDTSAWKADLSAGADLALSMQSALSRIYNTNGVRLAWYMNRQSYEILNQQLIKRQANWLEWLEVYGRRVPTFMGIPIRVTDAILNTEAAIT